MQRVHHMIRLTGHGEYGGEAPPIPVGNMLRSIGPAVRQSILMGFLGRSRPPGRPPTWLVSASDIRFVGIDGGREGETILHLEAPRLGEADELYRQQEFWPSRPSAQDTGLDLLCDILGDVTANKADSDRFDSPLLKRISGFGRAFERDYQRAVFVGDRYTEEHPAVLDEVTIANAQQLTLETPRPQRIRVVGLLEMIRMSSQGFELLLDDGSRARGVLIEGDLAAIEALCGNRVLVQGLAIYRPSGRLLRIDANRIEPGDGLPSFWSALRLAGARADPLTRPAADLSPEGEVKNLSSPLGEKVPEGRMRGAISRQRPACAPAKRKALWSVIPPPRARKLDTRELRKPQGPGNGVSAFFGKWPGDESDAEWNAMIEGLS